MTAPALIAQSDLTRAAKVAKAQGCIIEIRAGNTIYRIMPTAAAGKPDARLDDKPEINL